jgi:hypothetical protein
MTVAIRSDTSCRAVSRSVPRWKISSIDDSCSTDLERIVAILGMPLSACSRGIVTSSSTSAAASPRDGVWISTRGGANSGKTSTALFWSAPTPKNISPPVSATTM